MSGGLSVPHFDIGTVANAAIAAVVAWVTSFISSNKKP